MNNYILRNRKNENKKIFYLILIISIIISYVILSIESLDIFRYVSSENKADIASSANFMYIGSISFIFFLIYMSIDYSISERKKEIGIYIIHGISFLEIFKNLIVDFLKNTIISMLIGIPLAIFINELINLFTIKILDLGIDNHKFALYLPSIVIIFIILFIIEMISLLVIISRYVRDEPINLLKNNEEDHHIFSNIMIFIMIAFLLLIISNIRDFYINLYSIIILFLTIIIAILLLIFIVDKINIKDYFFKRQLLDILSHEKYQIIMSIYIMVFALTFLIIAILTTISYKERNFKAADFTLVDESEKIEELSKDKKIMVMIENIYPIYARGNTNILTFDLNRSITNYMIDNEIIGDRPYIEPKLILNEDSFINISKSYGKSRRLKDDEAIILNRYSKFRKILLEAIEEYKNLTINLEGKDYKLINYTENSKIFSNDVIRFFDILVVNDKVFNEINPSVKPFAYNIILSNSYINKVGFIKASDEMRNYFIKNEYKYESYIWERKNDLSDIVNTIYGILYIGIIFFLTATAYIAIRILIIAERNKLRYKILLKLGEDKNTLKKMLKKEIYMLYTIITLLSIIFSSLFLYIDSINIYSILLTLSTGEFNINIILIFIAIIILNILFANIIVNTSFKSIEKIEM